MNGYQPSTPRTALAFIAVAMAVVTVGAMVVLPAKFDSLGGDPYTLAAEKRPAATPRGVTAGAGAASSEVAAGSRGAPPAATASATSVHSGRTILGTQQFDGKRRKVSLRGRTRL